jgi:hypothetical protein
MLSQGQVPVHPRFEWLRRQARTFLERLIETAKEYDTSSPSVGDKISMVDLLDICGMTAGHIEGAIKTGSLDPMAIELVPYEEVQPRIEEVEESDEGEEEES